MGPGKSGLSAFACLPPQNIFLVFFSSLSDKNILTFSVPLKGCQFFEGLASLVYFRPSVVHINDERATSTDLSIIDLDRIWDSLVSTSGSQPVLSVSSSEIISSML